MFASGSVDASAKVWDLRQKKSTHTFDKYAQAHTKHEITHAHRDIHDLNEVIPFRVVRILMNAKLRNAST